MAETHARQIGFAHLGSHRIVLGRDDDAYDAFDCCTIVLDWELLSMRRFRRVALIDVQLSATHQY